MVHQKLHEFKNRHYSSHYMTLTIQSQETLNTLQSWVEESFSNVPNNHMEIEKFSHLHEPFATERFNKLYKITPVQNVFQIDLNWALPPMLGEFKVKPLHYLSWVIGHEGKASVLIMVFS